MLVIIGIGIRRNKLKHNYSELLTSQWSFKNDGTTLIMYVVSSFILCFIAYTTDIIDNDNLFLLVWPVVALWSFCTYQGFKMLVFVPFCYVVYYYAKKGDPAANKCYDKMLTWRK